MTIARSRRVVKLSDRQYANALPDLFGVKALPVEVITAGSSPVAFLEKLEVLRIDDALVDQYGRSALAMAAVVRQDPRRVGFACTTVPAKAEADPCVRGWIQSFVGRALRRPLTSTQLTAYGRAFDVGAAQVTYRPQGRYFRLTDVHGHVVKALLAG